MKTTKAYLICILILIANQAAAQEPAVTEIQQVKTDSALRIINLNPFINLQVDSSISYNLELNQTEGNFFWYLRGAPLGVRVNKDNGLLTCRADRSFFLSGKLRYDYKYNVQVGVHDLRNNQRKVDTTFVIIFYNTEVVPSRIRPSVSSPLIVDEGDTINFRLQCEAGSFPITQVNYYAGALIKGMKQVKQCDDEFVWVPPFDFVEETDSGQVKIVNINFVGSNKFMEKDTALVRIVVRNTLNYPLAVAEYQVQALAVKNYILQLKYSFLQLDRTIKKVKSTRTAFDVTSSATALSGTILNTSSTESSQKAGKILPGVGLALVPVKEAVSPQKVYDQNQASLVRTSIKRLEYMLADNSLVGEKDPNLISKTAKLKEELKQVQIQLIDMPVGIDNTMSEEELTQYFNNPRVSKKYRLKKRK